jgi:hypothetical protein
MPRQLPQTGTAGNYLSPNEKGRIPRPKGQKNRKEKKYEN